MLFHSTEFLLFFAAFFLLYALVRGSLAWRNRLVVAASHLFYGWWDWRFLGLLAGGLEEASRAFRPTIPTNTRLVVGLTPVPASHATARHADQIQRLLATWAGWLHADRATTQLSTTRPDDHFATLTHLNRRGVEEFTEELARALSSAVPQ